MANSCSSETEITFSFGCFFFCLETPSSAGVFLISGVHQGSHWTGKVPFGEGYLSFLDSSVASKNCEELFTSSSPHIGLSLDGVDIIANMQLKRYIFSTRADSMSLCGKTPVRGRGQFF